MIDTEFDEFSKPSKPRPIRNVIHIFILLIISKSLKAFGLFLTYDLLKSFHFLLILFITTLIASIFLLLIQKPFASVRLTKSLIFRLIKYTLCFTMFRVLWMFGFTLCGPLRTILLFEHSDVVILTCCKVLFSSSQGTSSAQQNHTSKIRGAVFFLLAILAIFAFDNDDVRQRILDHPEGHAHHRLFTHIFYRFTSLIGVADHKGGVIVLLIALGIRSALESSSKRLVYDIGGPKKLYALATTFSTICLVPISFALLLVNHLLSDTMDSIMPLYQAALPTSISVFKTVLPWMLPFLVISILLFVTDFYIEQIAITKIGRIRAIRYGIFSMISAATVASYFWTISLAAIVHKLLWFAETTESVLPEEHALSGGVVFAIVMFIFATDLIAGTSRQNFASFVGYGQDGIPLFNLTQQKSQSLAIILRTSLKEILVESDSRKIFYFLCINLMFTFVELLYGAWTNSLGLISDGFHMLFDCAALVVGLYAALMCRWKPTRVFSYGYGRVEVLSGFVNGLFLVVVSFFVFYEGVVRLMEPPEINTNRLLTVSVIGFVVNMIGIFSFSHAHAHAHGGSGNCPMSHQHSAREHHHHDHSHSHSHSHGGHDHGRSQRFHESSNHHGHSHSLTNNANMKGVFLHVLADTLGSVGVIISSLLIQYYGWYISDPICSLFISIMIFLSVLPLLKESAMTLLLQTSPAIQYEVLDRILKLDHVLSYSDEHFWTLSSTTTIGTIHIQMTHDGDGQRITSQVQSILREAQIHNVAIQIEKQSFFNHLSGLSSALGQLATSQRTFSHK